MEEGWKIFMAVGLPTLTVIVCTFLLIRKNDEIRELKGRCARLDYKLRLDWCMCSTLLTKKSLRNLIIQLETFDGTEEEAREIADSGEFESFAAILECLLSSPLNIKESNSLPCQDFVKLISRAPIFSQTICMDEGKYPCLIGLIKSQVEQEKHE